MDFNARQLVSVGIDIMFILFFIAMLILTQKRIELLHDRLDYVERLIDTQKNEVVPDYQSLIQLHH